MKKSETAIEDLGTLFIIALTKTAEERMKGYGSYKAYGFTSSMWKDSSFKDCELKGLKSGRDFLLIRI